MKLPTGYVAGVGVVKASGFGGIGQRMMEGMGWSKGQGLGKNKHGMAEALEVKKKEDTTGIGATGGYDWAAKAWEAAFNQAAKAIDHDDSDSSCSDDSSDDDEPHKGVRLNRDGTIASGSKAELKLAKKLAEGSRAGRFGGRAGKMARVREQEAALAAAARDKLGVPLPANGAAANGAANGTADGTGKKRKQADGSAAGDAAAAGGEAAARRKVVIVQLRDAPRIGSFRPTPKDGWWGAKYFMSVGALEGLEEAAEHVSRERKEFTEGDQEALYMSTHEHQRQGKRGLGKSEKLKLAAGEQWQGSKQVFSDDGEPEDEKDEDAEAQESDSDGIAGYADDSPGPASKSGRGEQAAGDGAQAGKIKWAKCSKSVLKGAKGGKMKLKKFWPALEAHLRELGLLGRAGTGDALQDKCLAKLRRSSKFVVEDKVVRLAASG